MRFSPTIFLNIKSQLSNEGYTIIPNIFTTDEINTIIEKILELDNSKPSFRKSGELFSIRRFLREVPGIENLIFNDKLKLIISHIFGEGYFVVKSIYFDKPESSNWFVAYHQDLTISVDTKTTIKGYGPWTIKESRFYVQPPLDILEQIFTIRIHLDDTDENNGALNVIPGSHLSGIRRSEAIRESIKNETACKVRKGGIMIMRPLLLHASKRSTNQNRRRVIHIEFCNRHLDGALEWSEKLELNLAKSTL